MSATTFLWLVGFGFLLAGVPALLIMRVLVNESQRKDAELREGHDRERDLLDRLMAQDFTQYVAVTNQPQPAPNDGPKFWDPTGLIEADEADE